MLLSLTSYVSHSSELFSFDICSSLMLLDNSSPQDPFPTHQVRGHETGYTLKDRDYFSVGYPAGVLEISVSHYHSCDGHESRSAFNTTIKLVPRQRFLTIRSIIQLQYLEIQQSCRLPDPRPRFKIVSVRPVDSPIFQAIATNNLQMTRSLLVRGKASIYDQDRYGNGLIYVRMRHSS